MLLVLMVEKKRLLLAGKDFVEQTLVVALLLNAVILDSEREVFVLAA